MKVSFNEDAEKFEKVQKCLEYLAHHKADVGLTSSASARSKFLLGIHEHGAPIMRIPPRPVIRPALSDESVRIEMGKCMLQACASAAAGDMAGTVAGLEASGQAGVDGIHAYIDAGIDPPNAPVTLSGGWIFNRVARKGVYVKGKSGSLPLVDTGQLYNDFDYEVSER